jgi:hypothetical protein
MAMKPRFGIHGTENPPWCPEGGRAAEGLSLDTLGLPTDSQFNETKGD